MLHIYNLTHNKKRNLLKYYIHTLNYVITFIYIIFIHILKILYYT